MSAMEQQGFALGTVANSPPAASEATRATRRARRAPARQGSLGTVALASTLARLDVRHRGEHHTLVLGDTVAILNALPSESVDLIFADPPYNLSNGGTTCRSGQRVSVDKGDWDESEGASVDHEWNVAWLTAARRVLKPTGAIWVSGTQHVIFSVGYAMQTIGYHLLNTVTWFKRNAAPNLGCRTLTHSTELVVWAAPARYEPSLHTFNYAELRAGNEGKQVRDLWEFLPPADAEHQQDGELAEDRNPTQKPLRLLDRIVLATSRPGDVVLDPFNGSGTSAVAAVSSGRTYIGIDERAAQLDLTARRLAAGRPFPSEEA